MPKAVRYEQYGGIDVLGQLEIPIAGVYALSDVQAAFQELAQGHTRGKIVLKP